MQMQAHAKLQRQCSSVASVAHGSARLAIAGALEVAPNKKHLLPPTSADAGRGDHPTISARRPVACHAAAAAGENRQEKLARESAQVEDRVVTVDSMHELKQELARVGGKLVVLELQGEGVCEAGFDEEPELHWRYDQESAERKKQEACQRVKSRMQRTARECPDVTFLAMQVPDGAAGDVIKEELGVQVLPAVCFFRQGELLWHQEGYDRLEDEIGEGVLYYGDSAGGGVKASEFVTELTSPEQLDSWLRKQPADLLSVVNVSTSLCTPCVRVYPAVLALAKNFIGQAAFARLLADELDDPDRVMAQLRVLEVPTFIFYRAGREVGRHVGSSRGDLIGQILKVQADAGIRPPPPPPGQQGGARRGGSGGARARAGAGARRSASSSSSRW